MTPGKVSFINSNNFLQTVYKKLAFYCINLGNYPTKYIMFAAIVAFDSFPYDVSTKVNKSFKVLTKKVLSS
jgi:hypothetical protein